MERYENGCTEVRSDDGGQINISRLLMTTSVIKIFIICRTQAEGTDL